MPTIFKKLSLFAVAALLTFNIISIPTVRAATPNLQVSTSGQNQFQVSVSSAAPFSQIDFYNRQANSTLWNSIENFGSTDANGNFNTTTTLNTYYPDMSWIFYVRVGGQNSNVVYTSSTSTPPVTQPYFTTSTLPTGYVGSYYQTSLGVAGGTPPYTFAVTAGNLPAGLTLTSSGTIQGYPSYGGSNNFTISATDNASRTVSQNFTLVTQGSSQIPPVSNFQNGSLVLDKSTVYIIYRGQKIGFANPSAFTGLGYSWTNLYGTDTSSIPQVGTVSSPFQHHPSGSWVNSGQTVYFVHDSGLIPVTDYQIFLNNGGQIKLIVPINQYDRMLPTLSFMTYNDSRLATSSSTTNTLTVSLGQTFTISLDANPSTGYDWQANYNSAYLSMINKTFVPYSSALGSGGLDQFQFRALQRGQTYINFSYLRSWENIPIQQKQYTIIVQ